MKIRVFSLLLTCLLPSLSTIGCSQQRTAAATESAAAITLCGDCGQIKGSESCCVEGAAACADCGLVKGSPGCCKIEPGTDALLCACGAVKGSDGCCAADAIRCAECGKIKGTPGCCLE